MRTHAAITIRKPVEEVYAFWRDLERLPTFMYHLESVRTLSDTRSHWVARGPLDSDVEWDAEITEDQPNAVIGWGSVDGTGIENSGRVVFSRAPRDQGTEVRVEIEYLPPAGPLGAAVAKLFGEEPAQQAKDDLRRLKQVMETGEVVVSDGSPEGMRMQRNFNQRAAQPLG